MVIYLGNKKPVKIYKGTTELGAIYLGNNVIYQPSEESDESDSDSPTPVPPTPSGSFALKMSFDTPFDYTSNRADTWHLDTTTSNLITEADSTFGGAFAGKIKTSSTIKKVGAGGWAEPPLGLDYYNGIYTFFNNSNQSELFIDTWFYAPKVVRQMQEIEGYDANDPDIVDEWGGPTDEYYVAPANNIIGFRYNSGVDTFTSALRSNITNDYQTPSSLGGDFGDLLDDNNPSFNIYTYIYIWDTNPTTYSYNLFAGYTQDRNDWDGMHLELEQDGGIQPETWHHTGVYRASDGKIYVLFDGHIYLFNGVTFPNLPNIIIFGGIDALDWRQTALSHDEVRVTYGNPLANFNLTTMTYSVPTN